MDSINQTPNKHPTIFQQAPKRLEPVLNLETSIGDLFGELMWRALLESSNKDHFERPFNGVIFLLTNIMANNHISGFKWKTRVETQYDEPDLNKS